jgi:hypothetical protein
MSCFHSDVCTKEEIKEFKKKVIDWLENYGIDTSNLDIRGYRHYNGDVKIFTGDYLTVTNQKSSFRKTETIKEGNIIKNYGTRGYHETTYPNPIIINRDEFDDWVNNILGEYKDCYDDYFKLEKIKKEYSKGGKS